MPQPPVLSSLKQGKKETSAFLHSRSAELILVDNMIDAYNQAKTPMWLFSLRKLLDAWLQCKVKSNGKVSTIRDDGQAVTRLKQALDTAFNANTGMMEEEMRTVGFGRYAYEELCENSIRHENGVARRTSYLPGADSAAVTATVFT
jgi:hypothetical protein